MRIYDAGGNERDWDWLIDHYGDVRIQQPDADRYFQVVEIREKFGDSAFVVKVLNADGTPKVGKTVLFYWPDAPDAPGSGWLEQAVGGTTNENGDVGFGMGPGAYYTPPAQGPHKTWLFGENVSEMVEGIGMIALTNHNHFDVVYQYMSEPEPPEPEPGDLEKNVEAIRTALERIQDILETVYNVS